MGFVTSAMHMGGERLIEIGDSLKHWGNELSYANPREVPSTTVLHQLAEVSLAIGHRLVRLTEHKEG